jgi:hypothetical protein
MGFNRLSSYRAEDKETRDEEGRGKREEGRGRKNVKQCTNVEEVLRFLQPLLSVCLESGYLRNISLKAKFILYPFFGRSLLTSSPFDSYVDS